MAGQAQFSPSGSSTYAASDAPTSAGLQERQLDAAAAGESRPAVRLEQPRGDSSAIVSARQSQAKPSAVRQPEAEPASGVADVEALADLPAPSALEPLPGSSMVEAVAAIAAMALVASLLLGMLTLVARFVRGSWNP